MVVIFIGSLQNSHAQYKVKKGNYNFKDYTYQSTDKYHPAIAGVASYIVPGLGQIYCNENKRGLNFLAGYTSGILVIIAGAIVNFPNTLSSSVNNELTIGKGLVMVGGLLSVSIQIWSTVDAIRVAKVNNMVYRANDKVAMSLSLKPNITIDGNQTLAISLAMKF